MLNRGVVEFEQNDGTNTLRSTCLRKVEVIEFGLYATGPLLYIVTVIYRSPTFLCVFILL